MWSTEKFGAVSSQVQEAARRASTFPNPTAHSVSDEPFISSDFGVGPRFFCVRLRRKCGKLNRQTPIYRKHSKSQKTNNRDLLKSPKNQILQHHTLRACGLILNLENQQLLPFLTGSRIAPLSSTDRALSAAGTLTFLSARRPIRYNVPGPNFSREARNLS